MAKIEHVERVVLAVRKLQQSVLFSIAMHIAVLKDEDVCVVVCYSFFFFFLQSFVNVTHKQLCF